MTRTGYRNDVYRFLLSPRWIAAHIALIAAVAVCAILGLWQGDAFRESKARHDARGEQPVALSDLVAAPDDADDAHDRPVMLRGTFDADAQLLVPGRVHDDRMGSYVVTILHDESGIDVPVVRGWITDPDDPGIAAPTGTVSVTAHVLPPEHEGEAVIRSDRPLEADQIGYLAPAVIAGALLAQDESALLQGFAVLDEIDPPTTADLVGVTVGDVDPIRDVNPWQNASYWAQWWIFGLAAVVFWGSAVRAAVRSRRADVSEPGRAPAPS